MPYHTIISAQQLFENITNTAWLILDCRGTLINSDNSYRLFFHGHIPNAYYCCEATTTGCQPAEYQTLQSSSEQIKATLLDSGFNKNTQIIIYDQDNSDSSNDIWLQLRAMGMQNVAVLQGGFNVWQSMGYPITSAKKETAQVETIDREEALLVS